MNNALTHIKPNPPFSPDCVDVTFVRVEGRRALLISVPDGVDCDLAIFRDSDAGDVTFGYTGTMGYIRLHGQGSFEAARLTQGAATGKALDA